MLVNSGKNLFGYMVRRSEFRSSSGALLVRCANFGINFQRILVLGPIKIKFLESPGGFIDGPHFCDLVDHFIESLRFGAKPD